MWQQKFSQEKEATGEVAEPGCCPIKPGLKNN